LTSTQNYINSLSFSQQKQLYKELFNTLYPDPFHPKDDWTYQETILINIFKHRVPIEEIAEYFRCTAGSVAKKISQENNESVATAEDIKLAEGLLKDGRTVNEVYSLLEMKQESQVAKPIGFRYNDDFEPTNTDMFEEE